VHAALDADVGSGDVESGNPDSRPSVKNQRIDRISNGVTDPECDQRAVVDTILMTFTAVISTAFIRH